MQKFNDLKSVAAVINEINIDTDAIIPKQFLKTRENWIRKISFFDRRYDSSNNVKSDFILNKVPWNNARILIAGNNFRLWFVKRACSLGIIRFWYKMYNCSFFCRYFFNNSIKNGLLPLTLPKTLN